LAASPPEKIVTPVALPPGLARLETKPSRTGSSPLRNVIGIVLVAASAGAIDGLLATDHRYPAADQVGGERRQPVIDIVRPAILDRDVLAFGKAGFLEALLERGRHRAVTLGGRAVEKSDHGQRRLLRQRGERPRK
jgi:hypothetical protein